MSATHLGRLLADAADRGPDCAAVRDTRGVLTYAQLDRRANQLAAVLREAGVRPGDRVGLFFNKCNDAIVGLYGILKAGAAYVPLDPLAPAQRLGYIARDCGLRCLLTHQQKAREWGALVAAGAPLGRLVVLDARSDHIAAPDGVPALGSDALDAAPAGAPPGEPAETDLAYILYTSGSTGQPKGVMLSHRNALAFVQWCHGYFGGTGQDVFSNHAPLHFDLTILDIFAAAMAGATLAVVPPEISVFPVQLARFIEDRGITIWYSVPSVLTLLVLRGHLSVGQFPALRHVIFAGEVFPTRHLRALMTLVPHARFTNLYGPTETNVCTYYAVPPLPPDQTESIPIGVPIDGVDVFIVDEAGQPVADGETGELQVRGPTVAQGYWGDPGRTARAFVEHASGPLEGRVYRTGDLVRRRADGNIVFLGRRDHQIKSRGYRIELGEIEAALSAHPAVAECAVVAIPDDMVGNRLKAFVVSSDPAVDAGALTKFCAGLLPRYMLPELFEFVPVLPRTSTGKTDRTALAAAVPRMPNPT